MNQCEHSPGYQAPHTHTEVSYRLTEIRQMLRGRPVSRITPFQYTGVLNFSNVGEQACDKTVVQLVVCLECMHCTCMNISGSLLAERISLV